MFLVRLDSVSLTFGPRRLLLEADFSIDPGERVCLIGRNGAGKTSLIKLINGELEPDAGRIHRQGNLCISELKQILPLDQDSSIGEFVSKGLSDVIKMTELYKIESQTADDKSSLKNLQILQNHIDSHGGWNPSQRVETVCTEMGLDVNYQMKQLSGGWQRRAALAQALVAKPDILLLDEPTNHLDFEAITWLEKRVSNFAGAILFITHDRSFLQKLATRIVEIDRGKLKSWPGNYKDFLKHKASSLESERQSNKEFDKKLEEEEIWIRQGIKARRTRNEGRVRALESMREEKSHRINPEQKVKLHIEEADQSSKKVLDVRKINFGFDDRKLIKNFSLLIRRGDRIGLVGNNGVGKSTLLKLFMGEIKARSGSIKWGENIQIGYFDQYRQDIDLRKTVAEVVGDGRDHVMLNGSPRHVIGYLRGFLFSPKRSLTPVRSLSGGERNRVILARLFTKPANFLILDEPTNDLDVETLEVLEERLREFTGTLITVSHDRSFLDNTVNKILVFESNSSIEIYDGGYSDWLVRGKNLASVDKSRLTTEGKKNQKISKSQNKIANRKLSYMMQRELDSLPSKIEIIENELENLQNVSMQAAFYEQPYSDTQKILAKILDLENQLESHIKRWSELEELNSN